MWINVECKSLNKRYATSDTDSSCVTLRFHQYSNMATYGYDVKLDDTRREYFLMQRERGREGEENIFVACFFVQKTCYLEYSESRVQKHPIQFHVIRNYLSQLRLKLALDTRCVHIIAIGEIKGKQEICDAK